mgnify:CR=1 FL=1
MGVYLVDVSSICDKGTFQLLHCTTRTKPAQTRLLKFGTLETLHTLHCTVQASHLPAGVSRFHCGTCDKQTQRRFQNQSNQSVTNSPFLGLHALELLIRQICLLQAFVTLWLCSFFAEIRAWRLRIHASHVKTSY